MSTNQFSLLAERRFLPLFITQAFGAFNDNVFKNALVMLITFRLANAYGYNAQILTTLAAGLFILPFFLFSATAGQLADKYEKSKLIFIIKCVELGLMVLATIGFCLQSVTLLMTVLFLLGVQATFFGPLKYAILPEQLHKTELIAGNGLIEAGTFLTILLGTICGGVLILLPYGDYVICAAIITFSICGMLSSYAIPATRVTNPSLDLNPNIITETLRVLRYAHARWDIYLSILAISWFWLVGATFLAEFPVFGLNILHANQNVVTLFFAVFSIGIGFGSLLCNQLLQGRVNASYVPLAAIGMSLFTFDLFFASRHFDAAVGGDLLTLPAFLQMFGGWRICFDLLCIAICGGVYTVPLYAIVQQRSAPEHRARVIASNNIINALFMVGAAVGTLLLLKVGFSVSHVFLLIGILNCFVALYICRLLPEGLTRTILRSVFTALYRVKVVGLENYEAAGDRVVIIANHTSFIDAILLAAFLPDKLTFAVNTHTAQRWWIKFFLMMVDAYPLDPTNPIALKSLIDFVKLNKRCVIFPEGRLTVTGALMKVYEGPGLIADKSRAQLLPIRIQGAQFTPFSRLRGKLKMRFFPEITITIFAPQKLGVPDSIKGRKRRELIGYQLYDLMTEMIFQSSPYRKTLFASLIEAVELHGKEYEIAEDVQRIPVSYKQFLTRSFILGKRIAKKTQPGENVGILLPNTVTTALCFFGAHAYSRVPAMLNYSAGNQNVVTACHTACIKTVYSSRNFVELGKLGAMIVELEKNNIRIIYLEDVRAQVNIFHKLKGVMQAWWPNLAYKLANFNETAHQLINDPNSPGVVLFTSGSEGVPKGVVLSHLNVQANRYQISACVDFTANDTVFNALPVFHSFGLTGGLLLPILSGVKIFFYPSPLHYRIIPEVAYDTNATIMFGTDTFLTAYAKYAHPYDFYSIRYIFAGAEKLRDETRLLWAQKFGVRVFEGYGATEMSPVIAVNTPMENKAGTVGRLLPALKYELKPVPGIDAGGVLWLSGPSMMKGYLLASDPGVLVPPPEGWYDTGDIVDIDEVGYITIKGRVKRFAKIAGEMVSLGMVEQVINDLWSEFKHAVISVSDERKGEQLILFTTNPDATRESIVNVFRQKQVTELAIPKKINIVKDMPLLGTGKVDYVAVKALL